MQNPQEVQAAFERQMKDRLSKRPFPTEKIHPDVRMWLPEALRHCTIQSLQCDPEHYKNVSDFANGCRTALSFMEAGFALNALEQVTPAQMDCHLITYAELMAQVRDAAKYWNEVVLGIKNEVAKSVTSRAKLASGVPGLVKGNA